MSVTLLVGASLVSVAHTLSADGNLVEMLSAHPLAPLDADAAAATALATALAAGPTAALAVAGCGVALGGGGRQGGALVVASSLLLLLADAAWLGAGPLGVRWADLALLGGGTLPARWQGLPSPLMAAASTFLLQIPLKATICVATTYGLARTQPRGTVYASVGVA